jgi:hypothetical protein
MIAVRMPRRVVLCAFVCVVALGVLGSPSEVRASDDSSSRPPASSKTCAARSFAWNGSITAFGLAPANLLVQAMLAQCWGPDFCYCGGSRQSGNTFYVQCAGAGCCPNENPWCSGTREASVTCASASTWSTDYDINYGCYVWCYDDSSGSHYYGWCC